MKKCPNCGCELEDDDMFCPTCGAHISAEEVPSEEPPAVENPVEVTPVDGSGNVQAAAFCPECGAALQENAAFCPECGAKITSDTQAFEEPPVKEKKKRKGLLIGLGAVLGLFVLIGAALLILLSTPKFSTLIGFLKTKEAIGKMEVIQDLNACVNGGSVKVDADVSDFLQEMGFSLDEDLHVNSTFYMNGKQMGGSAAAAVEYDGTEILDVAFGINQNEIVLQSKSLLGNTNYGVSLKDLEKNLEKSIFGPDGDYYIGNEAYDALISISENTDNKEIEELKQRSDAAIKDFVITAADSLFKNGDVKTTKETLDFPTTSAKTKVVEIEIEDKTVTAVARDLKNWLKSNSDVKWIVNYLDETTGSMVGVDFQEVLDEAVEALEDVDAEFDEELSILFYLSKKNRQLLRAEMIVDGNSISATIGPDASRPEEISFVIKDDYGKTSLSYKVSENSNAAYNAKLNLDGMSVSMSWDRKDGDFKIKGDGLVLKGNMKKSGRNTVIELDSVEADGTSVKLPVTVERKASGNGPSLGNYSDILLMDIEDFEDLIGEIKDNTDELMDELGDLGDDLRWMY